MKVVILTSRPYWSFLDDTIKPYYGKNDNDFWMSEVTTFPKNYDVGISFMHLGKVPAEQVNTHKWYNFHPAPLPAYRGRNLCYHAIMNNETEFGASLHYMDENFDTGAIIDVWHFPIHDWMTAGDVSESAIETSKALFQEYFPQILENFPFSTLENLDGTYYKKAPISDDVPMTDWQKKLVRAITTDKYYPKVRIGNKNYKIVVDE